MDHWAIDTQMEYQQEHLPMLADDPGRQSRVSNLRQPSSTSHQKWLASESLWIRFPPWIVFAVSKVALWCWGMLWSPPAFGWGPFWSPAVLGSGRAWVGATSDSRNMLMVDFRPLSNGGAMAPAGCRRFGSEVCAMTVSAQLHFFGSGTSATTPVPSETPGCSGRLWWLWWNLTTSDRELHASHHPGDGSRCILTSITLHQVYTPSERHVYDSLRKGCSYAVAIYAAHGDVYACLRPIATFYLSAIVIYRMPHSPHICLALRFLHILQCSLRFGYIACCSSCFAIIVFYRSEIYSLIFTLSSTMPLVLHILR